MTNRPVFTGRIGRRAASLALAAAALACRNSTGGEGTSSDTRAVVYGRVTTAGGAPVVRALVRATANPASCEPRHPPPHDLPVAEGVAGGFQTDDDGKYRQVLSSPYSPFTGCVRVRIILHGVTDTTQVAAAIEGATVNFRPGNNPSQYDSVRVDVQVP